MEKMIGQMLVKTTNTAFLILITGLLIGGVVPTPVYGGNMFLEKTNYKLEKKMDKVPQKHWIKPEVGKIGPQADGAHNIKSWLLAEAKVAKEKEVPKEVPKKEKPKKAEAKVTKKKLVKTKKRFLPLFRSVGIECPETEWGYEWTVENGVVFTKEDEVTWSRINIKSLSNTKDHVGYFFEK